MIHQIYIIGRDWLFMKKLVVLLFVIIVIPGIIASIVINEFTADPQTDWDNLGTIGPNDEFIELYNSGDSPVNITDFNITTDDTSEDSDNLSGIIPAKGFFVLLNPEGDMTVSGGQIILYNVSGDILDRVSYGSFNDGNTSDNAPSGNANDVHNECLARIPNGIDTDNDKSDFINTTCTFNSTNNVVVIQNKSETLCAIENKNMSLYASVNGSNIDSIWFSYTINGTNFNKTAVKVLGTEYNYSYTIPASELTNGTLSWNVYVNDSFGNIFSNSLRNVLVRKETILSVVPAVPDGLNNWYVSEPVFSLMSDTSAIRTYYQWDSETSLIYTGSFNLDDIPNTPPKESAGILDLHWWSEFACGNETEQEKIFFVDLKNPVITNLKPANNSFVSNNKPVIEALLDEVYQSNSGINELNSFMKLDSVLVPFVITEKNLDAIINFTPLVNLTDGVHIVEVYAEDNAGRNSTLNWSFEVNSSLSQIILTVNAPSSVVYEERRVPVNVSLNRIVDKLVYIDNGKEKTLCKNCDNYGRSKEKFLSLKEGNHTLTFKAVGDNESVEQTISLVVDSKAPQIKKIKPSKFSNGLFEVEFSEENPDNVTLFYKNPTFNISAQQVNISECEVEDDEYNCSIFVNLSVYDTQEIEYWFSVEDIVGRTETSKKETVIVDTTKPVLNELTYDIDENKVIFFFNVSEINFDKITFVENMKEKSLCTLLKNNICEKKRTFTSGDHVITIKVYDDAGNVIEEPVMFSV